MVEVAIGMPGDLELLLKNGFDVTYISDGQMAEVLLHSENERNRLRSMGLYYFVVHENAEQYYSERLKEGLSRDDMGGYPTYDEIVETIFTLQEDYPDIISEPISIGRSIEDRDIWAFRLSDNPNEDEDEPEILYVSLIHAREAITSMVLNNFVTHMVEGYEDGDEYITNLVNSRQMWFIYCQNPDGVVYNEEIEPDGGGLWRKNRRDNEEGSFGVDLNRNWGFQWGYDNVGSSPDPDDPLYRGTEAFSEPETQAVREFVNERNFTITFYVHSYGNLCLLPPGYDYLFVEDRSLLTALGQKLTAESGYLQGTGWETIYITNGDSDDWLYHSDEHDPIMAITIEVGTRQDHFWPPRNRVQPLIEENLASCIAAAEYCDNPTRLLLPPTPLNVTAELNEDHNVLIVWEEDEVDDNFPESFNVMVRVVEEPITDEVEPDQERWDMVNFAVSNAESHSASHSFSLDLREPMATLALREELVCPDTLWAWMNYNLREFYNHYIALEVSYDGFDWEPVAGSHTEDLIMNDHNLGPGITGDSDDEWIRVWFNLADHSGEMVRLRFRFYQFDRRSNAEQLYIDDIYPIQNYEWSEIIAEGVDGLQWIDDEHDLGDEIEYAVQSVDVDGDRSYWSLPAAPELDPNDLMLEGQIGWMLYSIPIVTDPNELEHLFAGWIDADVLLLVKNQLGQFFAPQFEFNQIEEWNPLEGYWIKLSAPHRLLVVGEWASPDSEIPLNEGWNSVGYLHRDPMPEVIAFDGISDNLILAKDGYGRFWINEYDFSNMGNLKLGRGYQLLMTDDDTLIYPALEEIDAVPSHGQGDFLSGYYDANFVPPSEHNHSILLKFDSPVDTGELVLMDSEGFICGMAFADGFRTEIGIAAWGESDSGEAGYKSGEKFGIEYHSRNSGVSPVIVMSSVVGGNEYIRDGFSLLNVSLLDAVTVPMDYSFSSFPNPFNGAVKMQYHLTGSADVLLTIFDSSGRIIGEANIGYQSAGVHLFDWNANSLPSGIYIAQLTTISDGDMSRLRTKMLLLR